MREVAVIGIGQTKVDEHWDKSLRVLAGDAILALFEDTGVNSADGLFIGNMLSGPANHQQHLGSYVADWVGMRGQGGLRIESACSSGAAAFRSAVMAVASGALDSAIAVGAEKMTDSPGGEITADLATAADSDWEVDQGISFVALNALIMRRYMYEYGWKAEHFAPFSINAHANGVHNPYARFQDPITEASYLKAPMIAPPINLMDASAICDGAAATLIVPLASAPRVKNRPLVKVIGSTGATDTIAVHDRPDGLWLSAAEKSSKLAYAQASISPADVDLFELHDAFTIMAALSLEASGFAERGQGPRVGLDGDILPTGRIPIATRGGLKSRGHPVGATGMYQIVEAVQQLYGEGGATQVPDARIAMTQNIGGSGSNIITHLFQAL